MRKKYIQRNRITSCIESVDIGIGDAEINGLVSRGETAWLMTVPDGETNVRSDRMIDQVVLRVVSDWYFEIQSHQKNYNMVKMSTMICCRIMLTETLGRMCDSSVLLHLFGNS